MIKIHRLSNLHIREAEAEEEVIENETPVEKVRVGLPVVSEAFMAAVLSGSNNEATVIEPPVAPNDLNVR